MEITPIDLLPRRSFPIYTFPFRILPIQDLIRKFTKAVAMSTPPYALLCLENPLLDIQAECNESTLSKYNLKANDAILAEPQHMGLYDDLLNNHKATLIAGGAAQNSARGAQYILPASSVLYIGAVGTDDSAKTLDEACAKAGLATEYLRLKEHPTGRCGVVITGHNRSMCTDLAAANHYSVDHLKSPKIWKHVEAAKFFYVGGYHLTVSPDAAEALGAEATKRNVPFVFGMGAPFIPLAFGEPLGKLLAYCDYVIGNETEAEAWGQANNVKSKKVVDIAKAIAKLPKKNDKQARTVIITQGTEPTIAVSGDKVMNLPVHPIANEKINDTNGAGDAFAGGFLAGLVQGEKLEKCIDMGMWLARLSIQELGPSYVGTLSSLRFAKALPHTITSSSKLC